MFQVQGDLTTLHVVGRIGLSADLKEPPRFHPDNPRFLDVVPDDRAGDPEAAFPVVIARLDAHGIDCYVWLELHTNRKFNEGSKHPAAMMLAWDPRSAADTTTPTEILGCWPFADEDRPA